MSLLNPFDFIVNVLDKGYGAPEVIGLSSQFTIPILKSDVSKETDNK